MNFEQPWFANLLLKSHVSDSQTHDTYEPVIFGGSRAQSKQCNSQTKETSDLILEQNVILNKFLLLNYTNMHVVSQNSEQMILWASPFNESLKQMNKLLNQFFLLMHTTYNAVRVRFTIIIIIFNDSQYFTESLKQINKKRKEKINWKINIFMNQEKQSVSDSCTNDSYERVLFNESF